jgi:hypothetical protein
MSVHEPPSLFAINVYKLFETPHTIIKLVAPGYIGRRFELETESLSVKSHVERRSYAK